MVLAREMKNLQDVEACYVTLKGDKSKVTIRKLDLVPPFMLKCGTVTWIGYGLEEKHFSL